MNNVSRCIQLCIIIIINLISTLFKINLPFLFLFFELLICNDDKDDDDNNRRRNKMLINMNINILQSNNV